MNNKKFELLDFPDELLCEIYGHMDSSERATFRTTCKSLNQMFKIQVPNHKAQEWAKKIYTIFGMALVEKLRVYNSLTFQYNVYGTVTKAKVSQDHIVFSVSEDNKVNLSFYFRKHGDNPFGRYQLRNTGLIRMVNDDYGMGIFDIVEMPKNVFVEDSEYLSLFLIEIFYRFVNKQSWNNFNMLIKSRTCEMMSQLYQMKDVSDVFTKFNHSKFISANQDSSQPTSFVYMDRVKDMVLAFQKDVKEYFYDAEDASYYMRKCNFGFD
jgi:hypothetical protein